MEEVVYSAAVLARIGEAADGFRDGKTYFFVVDAMNPRVVEWKATRPEAEALAATLQQSSGAGANWIIVGPCSTPADHLNAPAKWIECRVTVEGQPDRVWTNGESNMDALFFSLSAMDKFLFPYYTALYGPQVAADMRARFTAKSDYGPPCVPLCHDPKSDECACPDGGVTALLVDALSAGNRLF